MATPTLCCAMYTKWESGLDQGKPEVSIPKLSCVYGRLTTSCIVPSLMSSKVETSNS